MSVLKIKDQNNDWIQIPTIKGDKGDPFTYADFTPEQLESLKGKDGISPTVSVASDTSDDYRLSFTDETHTVTTPNLIPEAEKIFDVYPTDTASGSIASFPDGADGIPLKSCIVQVEPVQEGSGDPSPDNVRPITGWTGVNIYKAGQNLIPNDIPAHFYHVSPSAGQGAFVGSSNAYSTFIIPIPKGKICLARTTRNLISYGALCDELPTVGANAFEVITMTSRYNCIFDNSEGHKYLAITTGRNVEIDSDWESFLSTEPRLTIGDDVQPYTAPTNISTYPITFPSEAGTVYGAYVDVINGELVVDRAMVDLGTLTWNKYGSSTIYYTSVAGKAVGNTNIISDTFFLDAVAIANMANGSMRGYSTNSNVYFRQDECADLSAWTTWVTNHHPQLCYELAEPIHYPLTPNQINSLYGQNNLWANTGDTEVEYRASTKMYIDRKITEAVASALNS